MLDEARIRQLLGDGQADAAATEAIRALGPEISRYLRSLLRDDDLAADVTAEWAEHVWKGLTSFRWESSLRVWCYQLARNAALKTRDQAWQRRGRRLRTSEASALAASIHRSSMMLREDRSAKLDRLRAALGEEERLILVLRLDQKLSCAEIAGVLSHPGLPAVTEEAVRQRYHRIKEKMQRMAKAEKLL